MIASMASSWRIDTKLDQPGERAWDAEVVGEIDSAQTGSCCLHAMGDMQIFLDILRSFQFDTMQRGYGASSSSMTPSTRLSCGPNSAIKDMVTPIPP